MGLLHDLKFRRVTQAFDKTIKIKKLKKKREFTFKQLFHTAITVVVSGLHWRSPFDFSGMDGAGFQPCPVNESYLLLNHSTEATLVFHIYSNLYFSAGYIQEDGVIVLFWYVIFFFQRYYSLVFILS